MKKTTTIARVRVVVVDDDEDTRLYFQDILQSSHRFKFAGSFSTAAEALAGLPPLRPDLTLMDVRLPDLNGIECARKLKQIPPRLKIIMVTGTHEPKWVDDSVEAGARGFLVKPVAGEQLLATLKGLAGNPDEPKSAPMPLTSDSASNNVANLCLNAREMKILEGLAEGWFYKEIADKLGISCSAVHKTQHILYKKFGVSTRFDLIRSSGLQR